MAMAITPAPGREPSRTGWHMKSATVQSQMAWCSTTYVE